MTLRVSYNQEDVDKVNLLTDATINNLCEETCADLHAFVETFDLSVQWDLAKEAINQRVKRAASNEQ